jgi:hypothetical protein
MRQVQHLSARARKQHPSVGPTPLAVRPVVKSWLERLDPSGDPWPCPTSPARRPRR